MVCFSGISVPIPPPPGPYQPHVDDCLHHFGPVACASIRPNAVPPSTDCALRLVALELATRNRPDITRLVAERLRLALLCHNESGWSSEPPPKPSTTDHAPSQASVVVAPGGSDANQGTEEKPMKTLAAAIAKLRNDGGTGPKTLFVRSGVYQLDVPLLLGPADSELTITTFPGDPSPAHISGAQLLEHIDWTHASGGGGSSGEVAVFTAKVRGSFNAIFDGVTGKRQVLARTPNGDPESTLYPTGTLGSSALDWSTVGGTPAVDTRVILDAATDPNRPEWVKWIAGQPRKRDSMSAYYVSSVAYSS